ncbi:hypothetical protein N7478_005957 [Penicillium angulare]|uniref:uncharacterized protein n=1 Tax=Penicillium angulare TaxID=116970 RepID=UPI002541D49C|nr:uncharacterized protein N7478_005957 [Penicillium angulare]KAJ5280585.1 hypothetical protein N7478_005957 [Penicillium angulare]
MQPEQDTTQTHAERQEEVALLTSNAVPFFLPIPQGHDTLESTAVKLRSLANAIESGGRLSMMSGTASTPHRHDTEAFAKERMTAVELDQYEGWKHQRLIIPSINWDTERLAVPPGGEHTFTQRAAAMDIIWNHQGASPENASWLTHNIPHIMPLIKAVTKVLSAQQHLEVHDPLSKLSDNEIVETQSLRLITAVADENLARERDRLRQLAQSINESKAILMERAKSFGS